MIKVQVVNNSNGNKFIGRFNTEAAANVWIENMKLQNAWGEVADLTVVKSNCDAEVQSEEALKFLSETDWMVIRHRDQLDLGQSTSLTDQEYQQLLSERQSARNQVI